MKNGFRFVVFCLSAAIVAMSQSSNAVGEATTAAATADFLESVGVNTSMPNRGQPLEKTVAMLRYCGFRWVRAGIEGLSDHGPVTLDTYLELHRKTGVRFSWSLLSGGIDLDKLLKTAKVLDAAGALLAFEGNNEPNNWGVVYQGEKGGGHATTWLPVAKLQRDLYAAIKSDPTLKKYPVWSISEGGAETDNAGLQFLTIPAGAKTLLPDGTRLAEAACCHNYIYHPSSPQPADNKTWNAADPTSACKVDGLYGNYGRTWARHFPGYAAAELEKLPRVTTETGAQVDNVITDAIHGRNLMTIYLDQFKRGWSHTAVYILRDRTDEAGNQRFGFYRPDYSPRPAALYLHNLTTILADKSRIASPGKLAYRIANPPATLHDLLLQRSDGVFQLIVWNERIKGSDAVTIRFENAQTGLKIYDPTVGVEPIQTLAKAESLDLTLSDHPVVVEIANDR